MNVEWNDVETILSVLSPCSSQYRQYWVLSPGLQQQGVWRVQDNGEANNCQSPGWHCWHPAGPGRYGVIWNVIITPETMQQSSHHCQHRHYRHQPSIFSDKNPWPSLSHQYQCRAEQSRVQPCKYFQFNLPCPQHCAASKHLLHRRGVCAAGRVSTSPSLSSVCPCPDQHLDN